MKKIISLFIILLFSIGISAQKKANKKRHLKENQPVEEATYAAVAVDNNSDFSIDTLKIDAGKAYVFLIDVDQYSGQSQIAGDNQEENELIQNFKKNAFQIIKIQKYTYITFNNGQFLDISENGNSYGAIAYWSGNNKDRIKVQEGKTKATEFVAHQLAIEKESSYIINDKKYRKEIAALKTENNFTSASKEVMNTYLKILSTPIICFIEKKKILFNQNQEKVKTINTFFIEKNGEKKIYEQITLNEKGQPISVKHYGSKGNEKSNMTFEYQKDVLRKIQTPEKTIAVTYHDDQLIFSRNNDDAKETTIYRLENGELLRKSYTIMQDENFSHMNIFSEETIKNKCVHYEIDRKIWTINCSSKEGEFPFTYHYTSYQDDRILQEKKYKIIKKSDTVYEMFYSDDSHEKTTGDLKPKGTYHLNERNLLSSFNFIKKDDAKKMELEYTYFP